MAKKSINASQHLTSLGWAGPGHSLDSHTSKRGLSRPLLVTHKQNTRGLGSRSAKERQADQWWLNAFDAALRQANTTEGKTNGVSNDGPSALERVRDYGVGKGGLYGWFKKGEVIGSTFDEEEETDAASANKRRSDSEEEKKSARRRIVDNEGTISDSAISHKKRKRRAKQSESEKDNSLLPTPNSGWRCSSPPTLQIQESQLAEEQIRLHIKAELKRRKRAGEFNPNQTLSAEEQKKHKKRLKRDARQQLEVQLRQERLSENIEELTLSVEESAESSVMLISQDNSDVVMEHRRREKEGKRIAKTKKAEKKRLKKQSKQEL
jgi:nucleolar protein TMA23